MVGAFQTSRANIFLNIVAATMLYPAMVRGFRSQSLGSTSSRSRRLGFDGKRNLARSFMQTNGDMGGFKTATTLPAIPPNAHRVVLMRHGESEFNNANIFTGWCDVALTRRGVVEAIEAGQVFRSHELTFRKCYTSLLTRSIVTAHRALEAAGVSYTPLEYEWKLNERHYGALQGLSKERTADRLGREKVMKWRRSFEDQPPLMTQEHPHFDAVNNDLRYKHLERVPLGESLQDCQQRVVEAWKNIIAELQQADHANGGTDGSIHDADVENGYTLVVAHANSLRALAMHLDDIPADEIESLNIPTAIPFFYDIDLTTGQVIDDMLHDVAAGASTQPSGAGKFRGVYVSDERKKRSFLERRRAANDPWMWALHDHQVAASMLGGDEGGEQSDSSGVNGTAEQGLEGLTGTEEEARKNTQLFSGAWDGGNRK